MSTVEVRAIDRDGNLIRQGAHDKEIIGVKVGNQLALEVEDTQYLMTYHQRYCQLRTGRLAILNIAWIALDIIDQDWFPLLGSCTDNALTTTQVQAPHLLELRPGGGGSTEANAATISVEGEDMHRLVAKMLMDQGYYGGKQFIKVEDGGDSLTHLVDRLELHCPHPSLAECTCAGNGHSRLISDQ